MAGSTGKSFIGRFGVHFAVLVFVVIWTIPTLGILVSSLRDKDQIIASGWWNSFSTSSQTGAGRLGTAADQVEKDGKFLIMGNLFEAGNAATLSAFGGRSQEPTKYEAGSVAELNDGGTLQVNEEGSYVLPSPRKRTNSRPRSATASRS